MKKYLAFDIEIFRELPDEEQDWKRYRPLGISCAATVAEDEREPTLFLGRGRDGAPSDQMTRQEDCRAGYLSAGESRRRVYHPDLERAGV